MGVQVTIIPHVVTCASSGIETKFDQFQIRLGQRVVGYTAQPACVAKLVVRNLSEEIVNAVESAVAKFWNAAEQKKAAISQPIGAKPARPTAPPPDPADSAEFEANLKKTN